MYQKDIDDRRKPFFSTLPHPQLDFLRCDRHYDWGPGRCRLFLHLPPLSIPTCISVTFLLCMWIEYAVLWLFLVLYICRYSSQLINFGTDICCNVIKKRCDSWSCGLFLWCFRVCISFDFSLPVFVVNRHWWPAWPLISAPRAPQTYLAPPPWAPWPVGPPCVYMFLGSVSILCMYVCRM